MTKRIKILFTIPNFDTAGSGKVVYDLVKGLDQSRFAPEICCFHDRGAFFETVRTLGVPIHLFPFTAPYRPRLTFPFRVLNIFRFFRRHKFDLIHSWNWSSDISEPLAAKLAGIPFVYTKKAMGWESRFWKWRSRLSSRIVTINQDMVTEYFSEMLSKIIPIPLGVDTQNFKPGLTFDLSRKDLKLNSTDFVVITVANLVAVKGIEILIQALLELRDDRIKLLVVGDDENSYGQWLKQNYASDQIRFYGKHIDVRPYLALADVFVIPTKNEGRREGLPIALIEAMALGKIAIGSNVSGIKDVLQSFPEQVFEANTVEALKLKLKNIMNMSAQERTELGMDMAKHVQNTYNIPQFVSKHETLYLQLTT